MATFLVLLSLNSQVNIALASGNFPEANNCNAQQPYQSVCTHSLHNLEGWYGPCRKTRAEAQKDADDHVKKYHDGNSRWTGLRKIVTP